MVEFHACNDMKEAINGGVVFGGTTCFAGQQVRWKRPAFGVLWGLVWEDLQGRLWMGIERLCGVVVSGWWGRWSDF